jgi:hypothetical protein
MVSVYTCLNLSSVLSLILSFIFINHQELTHITLSILGLRNVCWAWALCWAAALRVHPLPLLPGGEQGPEQSLGQSCSLGEPRLFS